eukprot:14931_2
MSHRLLLNCSGIGCFDFGHHHDLHYHWNYSHRVIEVLYELQLFVAGENTVSPLSQIGCIQRIEPFARSFCPSRIVETLKA